MGILGLWYTAQFINPNKPRKHYKTFSEQWREDCIAYKKKKAAEEKERQKQEEKQRKELEKLRKAEEREYKKQVQYDINHLTQVSRKMSNMMTLCLVDGVFDSHGFQIRAYVSFDNRDGDIFTIRAEMRQKVSLKNISPTTEDKEAEKEVVFEYIGIEYILSDEEIYRLCNTKDTTECGTGFERIYL